MQTLPQSVPAGVGITSNYLPTGVSSVVSVATKLDLFYGKGFGFIIETIGDGPFPPVIAVEIGGVGKKGSNIQYCTVNKWYDLPFTYLKATPAAGITTYALYNGALAINVGTMPFAFVRPVSIPPVTSIPAASGGAPLTNRNVSTDVDFTADPSLLLSGDGVAVGNASMFAVYMALAAANNFTAGVIDIWYYDSVLAQWLLSLAGLPIPTGARFVRVPVNDNLSGIIGLRQKASLGDRIIALPNGVATDGTATTIASIFTWVQ